MNSAITPTITEFFEKADRVLPSRLVESINCFAQSFLRFVPVMMRDFFLERLPGRFFGIFFRRISRKMNHLQTAVSFQPFIYFFAGMMRGLINPQNDFPARTSLKYLFKPTNRRVRILPVDYKWGDFFPGPEMYGPVNVLGRFASRAVRYKRLLACRIPSPCDRSFEINLALIAGQRDDFLPAQAQVRKNFRRFKLKAPLLNLAPFDVQFAPSLKAPVQCSHQLPRSALAIAKIKSFLDQASNRSDGPSAAHLSAWHRFLLKQLTELVQVIRLQATLAVLPTPARIILEAFQAFLLVGLRESG